MKRITTLLGIFCLTVVFQLRADRIVITAKTIDPPAGDYNNYWVVMWIQNASGAFIKTIGMWGPSLPDPNDFPIWNSKNGGNKAVDGITGATPIGSPTLSAHWYCNGAGGLPVPFGTYTYNLELSDSHSSLAAYAGHYVQGKIDVDGSSKTRNGTDSSVNSGSTYITNVTATYNVTTPAIALNPTSLVFAARQGESNPASQVVNVTNKGGGTLFKSSTTVSYNTGQPTGWMQAVIGGAGNSQSITNNVIVGSLAQGIYKCTVSVSSLGASNTPQKYPVTFNVLPPAPQVMGSTNSSPNGFVLTFPSPFHKPINVKMENVNNSIFYVVNTKGQVIRNIFLSKERRNYAWDAKDAHGVKVPSGIYYLLLRNAGAQGAFDPARAPSAGSRSNDIAWQSKALILQ